MNNIIEVHYIIANGIQIEHWTVGQIEMEGYSKYFVSQIANAPIDTIFFCSGSEDEPYKFVKIGEVTDKLFLKKTVSRVEV